MIHITTTIDIRSSVDTVWRALTDFAAYEQWNPFMCSASGELQRSSRLEIHVRQANGRSVKARPTLTVVDAPGELRWRTTLIVPALFTSEHHFLLRALDPTHTLSLIHI